MPRSSQVWLGDLVRALASHPHRSATGDIARLLGLLGDPADAVEPEEDPLADAAGDTWSAAFDAEWPASAAAGHDSPPREGHPRAALPALVPVARNAPAGPDWTAVPSLPEVPPQAAASPPDPEPLFPARSARAILQTTLTMPDGRSGPVRVDALVKACAQGKPCARLPRTPRPTLRFGVQVLMDLGEGMRPFLRDQRRLLNDIRALMGPDLVGVRYFSDSPLRGAGPGQRRHWGPYRPPSRGTRVLIVSDLGIGGDPLDPRRASAAEWSRLTHLVRRAGCAPVALVPYPKHRVPHRLRSRVPVIPWSERTTVNTVAAALAAERR
ncbi:MULTISPECIES: hypothetical protein [Streptomyces]|uniref:hypothetical protein n=1 Tax=Streptomyces TaxID=1883 RepID=UPI0006906BDC|nr:hypothetical protein [Streptomyces durhamensis]